MLLYGSHDTFGFFRGGEPISLTYSAVLPWQNVAWNMVFLNPSSFIQRPVTIPSLPPDNPDNDWIGPPDKVSNIRVMKFSIPPNETAVEREYRERREALQKWHHQFWTKHNKSFFQVECALY